MYGRLNAHQYVLSKIDEVYQAFINGLKPELTFEGTSGTYFLKDVNKKKIAIFKPIDEEVMAPNNPRGHKGDFGT